MLVLTRKRSEKIHIGRDIVIKVIKTGRSTVKLGIEAPTNVRVMRGELCRGDADVSAVAKVAPDDPGSRSRDSTLCLEQFPHAI